MYRETTRVLDINRPFPVRVLDNVFPTDTYAAMQASFPEHLRQRFSYEVGEKFNLNETHPHLRQFLALSLPWAEFYRWVKTPEFVDTVRSVLPFDEQVIDTKFEFSMLPANGGHLLPHPDTYKKTVTLVYYFVPPEWNSSWGGNFDVYHHLYTPSADFTSKRPEWNEVETLVSVPYRPNRCVIMKRTNNSLHGVRPLLGPEGCFRWTVTINLLKA